ncbi:MAG: 4Fe-4S dicluster domain-containing protein [Deltaproteobacteria bacterium]|nr:4Fe-4S dicluster domain-containing protein [Deltaproteobacteria bacterium]
MVLSISLYVALIIFGAGLFYKVFRWFRYSISMGAQDGSTVRRLVAAFTGIISTLFSAQFFTLVKVFILDVVLNRRILKEDVLRWLMHMCIYGGFVLLLLMHALGHYTSAVVFNNYVSTINPFFFLRDLFGVLVLVGIAIAIYRRFILRIPRFFTNVGDHYAIIIVAVILLSGIALEGVKMTSHTIYQQMVADYTVLDPAESRALEAYWVQEFGVVSPTVRGPFDAEILAQGRELNSMSCAECHARSQWAFTGYGVARIISPFALWLDRLNAHGLLWYIHFFACLSGLAYLPFSKMFHIIASPLSLLANAVMGRGQSARANIATRQMIELDACTHCGTCTVRCSVAAALEEVPNINILPSEKIVSIRALASGRKLAKEELKAIQEGVYLCTNCYRCTVVCPVGINLQDLWFNVREVLLQRGLPEFSLLSPLSFYRGLMRKEMGKKDYEKPLVRTRETIADKCKLMKTQDTVIPLTPTDRTFKNRLHLSAQAKTFSGCFGCQTCTNACPVVANYKKPQEILGLLPHQIMHACALGVRDLAFGSQMLWDCLTCYQCQEQCPQGVSITDVLYELKNLAVEYVSEMPSQTMERSR